VKNFLKFLWRILQITIFGQYVTTDITLQPENRGGELSGIGELLVEGEMNFLDLQFPFTLSSNMLARWGAINEGPFHWAYIFRN